MPLVLCKPVGLKEGYEEITRSSSVCVLITIINWHIAGGIKSAVVGRGGSIGSGPAYCRVDPGSAGWIQRAAAACQGSGGAAIGKRHFAGHEVGQLTSYIVQMKT